MPWEDLAKLRVLHSARNGLGLVMILVFFFSTSLSCIAITELEEIVRNSFSASINVLNLS